MLIYFNENSFFNIKIFIIRVYHQKLIPKLHINSIRKKSQNGI